MQAVYIETHGGPDVLTYGERPDPAMESNQVKVRVRATALNRLDLYTREGGRGLRREFPPPLILGGDCAGDVVEAGSGVSTLKPGDRVVVNPRISCQQCPACLAGQDDLCPRPRFMGSAMDGSYAELVAVPAANAHIIGDSVSYEEAAAVPTTFLPTWNMLVRRVRLKPWETVLVLSASAGVGTAAIQVAKNIIGARVIATTSTTEKAAKALGLGADEVINYNEEDITERAKALTGGAGVDAVVDHVGADFFAKAFGSLRAGGRYGICGATTGLKVELQVGLLFLKHQKVFGVFMGRNSDLRHIVDLASRGTIGGVIAETFPLQHAADAHCLMGETNFFGKIVLSVS